ncbi:hypothetical protein Nepgr_016128 [Nepenthes gracilis]|uniref:SHSP domain-containing protein n=1 Tax=Nepenthes gracilis TaxID=150966 RepID=A0AAD3SNG0_NEPGR|nr:hypothetical protein Nepgr_016128 [Nepenthes gracilis]
MALVRLALRNVQHRLSSSPFSPCTERSLSGLVLQRRQWLGNDLAAESFSTSSDDRLEQNSSSSLEGGKEVAVQTEGKKKWRSLFPRRNRKRSLWNWRKDGRDHSPSFSDLFPSAVGHALLEATENINRLFENLATLRPFARVKEKDDHYLLQYQVPGLRKEDLKITVHDGVLSIVGEHKEEEGEESDEEYSSAMSFGYYNASIVLPDDAKPDDIKAELKDGVLTIVVPKDEKRAKDVKEVKIY